MSTLNYMEKLLDGQVVGRRSLGEFVDISNVGVDKKINKNEKKVRLLNFVDVFKNQYISNDTPTMVVTANERKIIDCDIREGDIFITPSSEIIDEIGFSAMAIEDFDNTVYSYHITRLRINDTNILFPAFLNYIFSSKNIRKQIRLKAQGITRFGLTQPNWKSLEIPIPSLHVQSEIVRILDNFTELTAELTAELHARKKQYTFYRDKLLTFEEGEVEWTTLGDICSIGVGQAPTSNEFGNISFVNAGTTPSGFLSIYNSEPDTITTPSRGQGGIGFVGYQSKEFWCGPLCYRIKSTSEKVLTRFIYFFMTNNNLKIIELANMAGVPALNKKELIGFQIPIPPLEEQNRIVAILDKFDALTTSLTSGLPREIELRQKQYAYYRDMLLSFPKVESEA